MDADLHPLRKISIHALREEGDAYGTARTAITGYFYPRPPRGGRLPELKPGALGVKFLSTPSARRATWRAAISGQPLPISIHALREEGDSRRTVSCVRSLIFLSTPSARRATYGDETKIQALMEAREFLSTPSARRATFAFARSQVHLCGFLSTPSARRATRPLSDHTRA